MDVVVFSQPGCPPCAEVKRWLDEHGFAYRERNIREDASALQELVEAGYQATPVVYIGAAVVQGFNPLEMERLLS